MKTQTGVLFLALSLLGCGGSDNSATSLNNNSANSTATLSLRFTPLARAIPESQIRQLQLETFANGPDGEVRTLNSQRVDYARNLDLTIPSDSRGARIILGDQRNGQFVPVFTGLIDFNVGPGQTVTFQDPSLDPNPIPLALATPLSFTDLAGTPLTTLALGLGASQALRVRGGAFDLTDQVNYTLPAVLEGDGATPGLFRGASTGNGQLVATYRPEQTGLLAGSDSGADIVKKFSGAATVNGQFFAYDPSFHGGVRVAAGDVNGDGVADLITGAGAGGGPHVKVFDGITGQLLRSFFAYDPSFSGGVFVASGDVNGDGKADLITGAGSGAAPHVKVFSGATGAELASFFAFTPSFSGGVTVAAGDLNSDGKAEIIVGAGPGAGPQVSVFDPVNFQEKAAFFAYDGGFTGGVYVAAGDVDGDGDSDIVTGAGPGGSPQVCVFDGSNNLKIQSFLAYSAAFRGGVRVAVGDVNGDGAKDIITGAGPGAGPHVKVFSGNTEIESFFAFASTFSGGLFVAGVPGGQSGGQLTVSLPVTVGR